MADGNNEDRVLTSMSFAPEQWSLFEELLHADESESESSESDNEQDQDEEDHEHAFDEDDDDDDEGADVRLSFGGVEYQIYVFFDKLFAKLPESDNLVGYLAYDPAMRRLNIIRF